MKMKWIKFSDRWPKFTQDDIFVRGPQIGERKVKFQAALYPYSCTGNQPERFGFMFSDTSHPEQNVHVPMHELKWLE